jgi:hypothetical protein
MTNFLPGFSLIKNKVITPLLVATERVVEYFLPENYQQQQSAAECDTKSDTTDTLTTDERNTLTSSSAGGYLPEHFEGLTLADNEKQRMRRKRRYNQLSRDEE